MKLCPVVLTFLLFIAHFSLCAQINKPSLSPRVTIEQEVGLANVKLAYGQPSKNGRPIFGGLIPYGKLWRTGANSATTITLDKAVTLARHTVPAGTYGLYSIPDKDNWTIVLNKNSKLWGTGNYDEKADLIRFQVPVENRCDTVETLNIHFERFTQNGADLVIEWETTKVTIPLFMDINPVILAEISAKTSVDPDSISAQTYFDAAQYYYHKNLKLDQAAKWFDKAIEMRPGAFWYVYYRAELAYERKDYKLAKLHAEACLEAAKKSPSTDYGYIAKSTLLLKQLAMKG